MGHCIAKKQTENGTFVVPASPLDNILAAQNIIDNYEIYSPYDGSIMDISSFYPQAIKNTADKRYETIDHCPLSMCIDGVTYVIVSLDNSVRANGCGFPLKNRLDAICRMITNLVKACGGSCIIFFSESCRPSFDGANINDRKNEMTWFAIREILSEKCKLFYLGESTNNDDASGMSFGVSAFCTDDYRQLIHSILPRKILTEGFGSGCVGIKTKNGNCVWGIHFPLDFRSKGNDNLGAKTMKNLCQLMKSVGKSSAFGDFNTIPGDITDAVKNSIDEEFSFIIDDGRPTFFGAYYDEVKLSPSEKDEWVPLI